ncbi:MAG: hypothetical protein OXU20_13715 [Myxococcales bacterium]|nr:hypothetical protein [Myxococcales bacterium]
MSLLVQEDAKGGTVPVALALVGGLSTAVIAAAGTYGDMDT